MPFPVISVCLVCEGARPEVLGKWTLLGFFGPAPNVRIAISNFSNPVSLVFVFAGGEGAGHFRTALRVTAQFGQTFPGVSEAEGNLLPDKPTSLFFFGLQSVVPGPGIYRAALLANGQQVYETTFELVQGNAEEIRRLSSTTF